MNVLNFSQFAWAYTFCQNAQLKLQSITGANLSIQLKISTVSSKLISSVIIHNQEIIKNDKNTGKFKIIFDIIPQNISWIEMCQRWQQIARESHLREYYVYAPHSNEFFMWQAFQNQLIPLPPQQHYASNLLPIRFEHYSDTLEVFTTQNQPFLNFTEQAQALQEAETKIQGYQTAIQEKQQLLDQAYQRLDLLERHYANYWPNTPNGQKAAS